MKDIQSLQSLHVLVFFSGQIGLLSRGLSCKYLGLLAYRLPSADSGYPLRSTTGRYLPFCEPNVFQIALKCNVRFRMICAAHSLVMPEHFLELCPF